MITPHLFTKPFQHPVRWKPGKPVAAPDEYWFLGQGHLPPIPTLRANWDYAWLTAPHPVEMEIRRHSTQILREGDLRVYEFDR